MKCSEERQAEQRQGGDAQMGVERHCEHNRSEHPSAGQKEHNHQADPGRDQHARHTQGGRRYEYGVHPHDQQRDKRAAWSEEPAGKIPRRKMGEGQHERLEISESRQEIPMKGNGAKREKDVVEGRVQLRPPERGPLPPVPKRHRMGFVYLPRDQQVIVRIRRYGEDRAMPEPDEEP